MQSNNIKSEKKRTFFQLFSLTVILMLGILLSLILILKNHDHLFKSQDNRYYSFRLGDALRQSDDYLTEYCKNFVITKDTIWEKKYWELVDIRRGKISENSGWKISMLDSMYRMGFSKQELNLLKSALNKSNQLVRKERIAMNAAKGLFLDSLNQFSIKREPNTEFALKVLHDQDYLLMKKEIMEPIVKFESLIELRTKTNVEKYKDKGDLLLIIAILVIVVTISLASLTNTLIIKRLAKIEDLAYQLQLRSKEQACLYKISQLTESTKNTLNHVLDGTTALIPFGWQYPEHTCARITFNKESFTSINFIESKWKQEASIQAEGLVIGQIEVFYFDDNREIKSTPFLKEEQILIETVSSILAGFYERKMYLEDLKKTNKNLETEIQRKITTEKELVKSDERFTLAAKASNAGIWDLDIQSRSAYWSPIHYSLLGYSQGEIMPTLDFVRSIVHDEDLELLDKTVHNHITKGTPLDFEARFYTKQNELRWYRSTGASSRDSNGKSVRIVGTFSDITDKKMADTALVEKEQQLQFALDVSNEGIWEIYKDKEYVLFSDRCYSMLGFNPLMEMKKQISFWKNLIPEEHQSKALINRINEIKSSGLHDSIYRVKTKSGDYKWIYTKGKAVEFSADNIPIRIVGTMTDITERMKQEEKIVNAILETEDKERSRIAREIHDGLQQTMSTSLMSFEKVRNSTDFKDKRVYDIFHMGYQYLKKSIEESRTLAHNLMPKVIDENGIVAAVESLISAIQNSTTTDFIFSQNINDERLKLSVEMTLYRIIQEGINNVLKYAFAETCNIQLLKHSDVLLLTIDDNGEGFNLTSTSKSFGINSMRTRAESIGAYFEIISKPTKGTQVLVELPVK